MLVKMLKTVPGADDGITVSLYREGESYEISERLAKNFFLMGAAEAVSLIKTVITGVKNLGASPENKMMKNEEKKDKKKEDKENQE